MLIMIILVEGDEELLLNIILLMISIILEIIPMLFDKGLLEKVLFI